MNLHSRPYFSLKFQTILCILGDLKEIDLQKLDVQETKELLNRVVRNPEDNEEYLLKLKNRIDRFKIANPSSILCYFVTLQIDSV